MNITMTPDVFLRLSLVQTIVGKREYSGYGFVTVEKDGDETYFKVYDVVLLDVGSTGWTEFDSQAILKVLDRDDSANMKLWIHAHPLGDGKPGPHNWSGTDNDTCLNEPLGCPDPDKAKWALAVVLTPGGWVGRLDQFKDGKNKTTHLPVKLGVDPGIIEKAKQLLKIQSKNESPPTPEEYLGIIHEHAKVADFDTAHAEVNEAFNILETAKFQIKHRDYAEAADSLYWCRGIAETYATNMYVSFKTEQIIHEVQKLFKKIPKVYRESV